MALEALASGTPVISTDNPGGLELKELFEDDVMIVPREDAGALARAVCTFLRETRRTSPATRERIERDLRPEAVLRRFGTLYDHLADSSARS